MDIQCFNIPKFNFKPFHISQDNKYFIETLYYYYTSCVVPDYDETIITHNNYGNYFHFVPTKIRNYIQQQHYIKRIIHFFVNKRHIYIHFNTHKKVSKIDIKHIIRIISFISTFSQINCSTHLDIYIIDTPFKKDITTFDKEVSQANINSAYTFACTENNFIYIYRKEEWKKVLIHECIHAFGIDFAIIELHNSFIVNKKLDSIFHLGINYNMNEAYCETLAVLINIMYLFTTQNKEIELIPFIETRLVHETIHSLIQSNKLLNHSSLSMRHLLFGKDNTNYTEGTSAISYYFIKLLFLYNFNTFLSITHSINNYSLKSNFTHKNIEKFIDLIGKTIRSNNFKKDMKLAEKLISQCPLLRKTMKLSFYG